MVMTSCRLNTRAIMTVAWSLPKVPPVSLAVCEERNCCHLLLFSAADGDEEFTTVAAMKTTKIDRLMN